MAGLGGSRPGGSRYNAEPGRGTLQPGGDRGLRLVVVALPGGLLRLINGRATDCGAASGRVFRGGRRRLDSLARAAVSMASWS